MASYFLKPSTRKLSFSCTRFEYFFISLKSVFRRFNAYNASLVLISLKNNKYYFKPLCNILQHRKRCTILSQRKLNFWEDTLFFLLCCNSQFQWTHCNSHAFAINEDIFPHIWWYLLCTICASIVITCGEAIDSRTGGADFFLPFLGS